ncbi:MAG: hypothetical protein FWG20_00830 [Candidatus Cloacimonetes bacterium]|nr:hypothetical protein [Candidatus Cloacimonadota bacterium]
MNRIVNLILVMLIVISAFVACDADIRKALNYKGKRVFFEEKNISFIPPRGWAIKKDIAPAGLLVAPVKKGFAANIDFWEDEIGVTSGENRFTTDTKLDVSWDIFEESDQNEVKEIRYEIQKADGYYLIASCKVLGSEAKKYLPKLEKCIKSIEAIRVYSRYRHFSFASPKGWRNAEVNMIVSPEPVLYKPSIGYYAWECESFADFVGDKAQEYSDLPHIVEVEQSSFVTASGERGEKLMMVVKYPAIDLKKVVYYIAGEESVAEIVCETTQIDFERYISLFEACAESFRWEIRLN